MWCGITHFMQQFIWIFQFDICLSTDTLCSTKHNRCVWSFIYRILLDGNIEECECNTYRSITMPYVLCGKSNDISKAPLNHDLMVKPVIWTKFGVINYVHQRNMYDFCAWVHSFSLYNFMVRNFLPKLTNYNTIYVNGWPPVQIYASPLFSKQKKNEKNRNGGKQKNSHNRINVALLSCITFPKNPQQRTWYYSGAVFGSLTLSHSFCVFAFDVLLSLSLVLLTCTIIC